MGEMTKIGEALRDLLLALAEHCQPDELHRILPLLAGALVDERRLARNRVATFADSVEIEPGAVTYAHLCGVLVQAADVVFKRESARG